jgi:VWFA-related protein
VCIGLSAFQQQPPQVFRGGVQTVAVYATVRDRDGRLVPDLLKEDFQILDNGAPALVTTFSNEVVPITAVLLIDMSSSMGSAFLRQREAARRFVQTLLPADRLRIGTFASEVGLSPHLTNDRALLERVLAEELWPGGLTPIWRASTDAMDSLTNEPGRRVILLLTDGIVGGGDVNCAPYSLGPIGPMGPCPTQSDVQRHAQQDAFMFYAIGFDGAALDMGGLVQVIDDTGGGHFTLKRDADVDATMQRVAEELHDQYAVGFRPAVLDGKTHRLDVRLTRQGLTARARKSYVAGVGA